jgi:hypothetical protein
LSRQTSLINFFKSSSGIRPSLSVLLGIVDDDLEDKLTVIGEVPSP